MNEIMTMRTDLANHFAAAGAELLEFTMTAGALAAIPNTTPQQYAVAGTLETIMKVLPAAEPSHPQRRLRHGDRPTEALSFDDALAAAPVQQAQPLIGKLMDEFSALPMLFPDGCQEPGALVRHSDVFNMLVAASKLQAAPVDTVNQAPRETDEQPKADSEKLRELAEAYRTAPLVFKTGERSHIDIALDAIFEYVAAARPTDDHLWDETIRDRDTYHDWADKLAEAISKHFGAYIGEHSNTNCPWAEALEAIECATPVAANQTDRDAEALDAARYRYLRGSATDIANVIDKEFAPGMWEYRAGEELDAEIDAAIRALKGAAAK
jgi:hypothetical protein